MSRILASSATACPLPGTCPFLQVAPWGRTGRRSERLQRRPRFLRHLLWHHHLYGDQQVTGGAVPLAYALAAGAQDPPGRSTRRHPEGDRTVQGGYPEIHAEDRLGEGDRHREREVVAAASE